MIVDGLPVYYIPTRTKRYGWSNIPYQLWAYFKKIRDTIKEIRKLNLKADAVWIHHGSLDTVWVGLKAFPQTRKVVHVHSTWTEDFLKRFKKEFKLLILGYLIGKMFMFLERVLLARSDAIIVYSEWMKIALSKKVSVPIYVVYNPVNFKQFNQSTKPFDRRKLGFKKGDKVILYVGKFTSFKGTEYLLESAKMLPNYKFLLIGQTGKATPTEERYSQTLPANVLLHKPIPHSEVAHYIKMCDCYVQPAVREGLEIPIAEALAVGKPVVTTNHPERKLIYENSVYYAEMKNAKSLALAIAEAIENGPKSSEKVLVKFDMKRNVDTLKRALKLEEELTLDVGCGYKARGDVNIDLYPASMPTQRINKWKLDPKKIKNFIRADAHYLPLKEKAFKTVYAEHLLEHCKHPFKVIQEFERVSKGKVIIKVPRFETAPDDRQGHLYTWTMKSLEHLLSQVFGKVEVYGTEGLAYRLSEVSRKTTRKDIRKLKQLFLKIMRLLVGSDELTAICWCGSCKNC
jgi:glycosyltransferase involved in cell wall biosynthesis